MCRKCSRKTFPHDPGRGTSFSAAALKAAARLQVSRIAWQLPGRVVGVDVQAQDSQGAGYALHYAVSVARQAGRWFVSAIQTPNPPGG